MSNRRKRFTNAELDERCRYLRQLAVEGVDVGGSINLLEAEREPCPLEITMGAYGGGIFESGLNVIFAVPVRFSAQSRIVFADCEFETEWDHFTIGLPYLRRRGDFLCLDERKFLGARVLNSHFEQGRTLNRGSILEGLILGYGYQSIPADIGPGATMPLRLKVTDTLHRSAAGVIGLPLERRRPSGRASFMEAGEGKPRSPSLQHPLEKHAPRKPPDIRLSGV